MTNDRDIKNALEYVLEQINEINVVLYDCYPSNEINCEVVTARYKLEDAYELIACAIDILKKKEEAKE